MIMSTAEIDEELRLYADLRGRMRAHAIYMIVRELLASPLGQAVKFEVRDGVMLSADWPCRCSSCEARKANVYGFIEAVRGRYRALFESRPAPS